MSDAVRANESFVRFEHVTKSFDGRTRIVDTLNLSVEEGEFLTMLGPSGSGKTTCLMMLAGFESPTQGEILMGGRPISRLPAHKRDIGVVFQNYALFPHMTVAENLAFPLRQRRLRTAEIEGKVKTALDMVELGRLGARYPRQLSGGQQQRVALARALVFEPRLILMDEPLGALDRRLREQMQIEIKQIHARIGMMAIYVTHDQSEALTMSDRIAVFNQGRIEQIDTPTTIYERPATPFVARFVGENNGLPATVLSVTNSVCRIRLEDGTEAGATLVDGLAPGDVTLVAIRPERISLGAENTAANGARVIVGDVVYNGDHVLLPCSLGKTRLLLKVPAPTFETNPVGKDETIAIGWETQAARAFRPTEMIPASQRAAVP